MNLFPKILYHALYFTASKLYENSKFKHAFNFYNYASKFDYNGNACLNLGIMCENGIGVNKNITNAFICYEAAAERNNKEGAFNTGICYYNGEGTGKDWKKALKYFILAAKLGDLDAQSYIDKITFWLENDIKIETLITCNPKYTPIKAIIYFIPPPPIDEDKLKNAYELLYPYQQETVNTVSEIVKRNPNLRGQVILPTGSGKTRIMEYLIGYFTNHFKRPICFATYCHRLMLSNNLLSRQVNTYVNEFGMKKLIIVTVNSNKMYEFMIKLNENYHINVSWHPFMGYGRNSFKHWNNDTDVQFIEMSWSWKRLHKTLDKELQNGRSVMFAVLYQSMEKLIGTDFKFDFAFYDEAHISSSKGYIVNMGNVTRLSNINLFFTATQSERMKSNPGIYGTDIINKLPVELVRGKFITPIKLHIYDLLNSDGSVMNYSYWEKVSNQIQAIMSVFESHTEKIHRDSKGKREPIFFCSVSNNKVMKEIIYPSSEEGLYFKKWRQQHGIDLYATSAALKGYISYYDKLNSLRNVSKDEFLERLNTEIKGNRKVIIIQIDQLNEGMDLPSINGVMNFRIANVNSYIKFFQFIGRSVRRDDEDRKLIMNNNISWDDESKFIKPCSYIYMTTNTKTPEEIGIQKHLLEDIYYRYGKDVIQKAIRETSNKTSGYLFNNNERYNKNKHNKEIEYMWEKIFHSDYELTNNNKEFNFSV